MWPSRPKWVALLLVHFLGTATSSKGGAMYRFWLFSRISFSSHFEIQKMHLLYTHTNVKSVIRKCLKEATLQEQLYDENCIWQFLKMTLFGVSDFTLSLFQNQWTDFDNFCIVLMRNKCYVLCCKNLKISERGYPCESFREVCSQMDFKPLSWEWVILYIHIHVYISLYALII